MHMQQPQKTADEALAWVQSQVNNKVGSGQCVALIQEYYRQLGFYGVSGNGCDYATNEIPDGLGWREKNGVPQKGDILIYTGGYGHVAICGDSTGVSWHQNWGGQYVQRVDRNYNASFYSSYEGVTKYYWGCIHVDFKNDNLGSPVNFGDDFYALIINTKSWLPIDVNDNNNVTLYTENTLQNQMWHFKKLSDGSYNIISLRNGKFLDVDNYGATSGTNVKVYDGNGSNAQKWFIYGYNWCYKLKAQCTDCVMDIKINPNRHTLKSALLLSKALFSEYLVDNFLINVFQCGFTGLFADIITAAAVMHFKHIGITSNTYADKHRSDRFFVRTAAWARNPGYADSYIGTGMRTYSRTHLISGITAHRTDAVKRFFFHSEFTHFRIV